MFVENNFSALNAGVTEVLDASGRQTYVPAENDIYNQSTNSDGRYSRSRAVYSSHLSLDDILDIVIRPVNEDGWIMGDDWPIRVHRDLKFALIKKIIEKERQIPACRQVTRHIRNRTEIEIINEEWTLRRQGLLSGDIINVQPTIYQGWLWNPINYYIEKCIDEIITEIYKADGLISIEALSKKVSPPRFVSISLQSFIRKYPDKFHIYTEITRGIKYVQRPKHPFHLPTSNHLCVNMGQDRISNISEYEPDVECADLIIFPEKSPKSNKYFS